MKKIIFILSIALAGMILAPSCDIVEEPYLKSVSGGGPDPGETVRKVLLEDYTGHKCPNCPEAAELAHNFKHIYQEQLVLLTVHAGFYASPDATGDFTADFRTPEGNAIHDHYDFFAYPTGLVNRTGYKGNTVLFTSDWEGAIEAIIDEPAQAKITLTNSYNAGSRTLTCQAETEFMENLSGTYHICVFIVESDIVSPQKNEQGITLDYVHNHVLRASMNGTWGGPVGENGLALMSEVQENEYSYVLPSSWVAANCAVVAFVYDEGTKEVLQAEEAEF